jgi:DNA polymerase-3 subunit epsilon
MFPKKIKRPLIVFDLETTGLDLQRDQIIQIAARKFLPAEIGLVKVPDKKNILNQYIRPQVKITKEAQTVHNISAKKLKYAPIFELVAKKLYKFFKNCDVCGYNILNFDIPILQRQFSECDYTWKIKNVIDCYQIFKEHVPHTLKGALEYYGRSIGRDFRFDLHDAQQDVLATSLILWEQLSHYQLGDSFRKIHKHYSPLDLQGKLMVSNDDSIALSFGKYKGIDLKNVPEDYLEYLWNNNVLLSDAKKIITEYVFGGSND